MPFIEDFNLLLKARYSLIYISTTEEDRLEYTIRNCVKLGKDREVSVLLWVQKECGLA